MALRNAQLAELLARSAESEQAHRRRALERAARAAFYWPDEASALAAEERPLTELRAVGPWVAQRIATWLADAPDAPEPPELRRGFLTLAEVRTTLAANPAWRSDVRGDLQMHTTYSDGAATLREMADAAASYGYEYVAVTDHSKGLPIARGMDETRLAMQRGEVARVNQELRDAGARLRILHSLEMNLSPDGEGDMDPATLAPLDMVLGAFHSKLRVAEDQTERYLKALRNPTFNVLAHPRGRRFNVRLGLRADWRRVAEAAAAADKALEIDAYPDRQDLDVETLRVVHQAGARVSIGTDAHDPGELAFLEFGLAAAIQAGIPRERILNFMTHGELLAWAGTRRR
jgi:DNA polymerase (family 10)